MKTKTIKLSGYMDSFGLPGRNKSGLMIELSDADTEKYLPLDETTPVTLSFEIPIPERKAEISESEFDQIFRDCYHSSSGMTFQAYLKQKLFGSESK